MITENLGNLILETQKGLRILKDQLDEFAKNNINDEQKKNAQTMYDHLSSQLKKFESTLDSKLDQVYKSILNDNNITIQKLPAIRTPDSKEKPKFDQQFLSQKVSSISNDLTLDPLSKLHYKKKTQKFRKPAKFSSLIPTSESLFSLSDGDLNQGLLQLITKGVITKDLNLTKILEGKVPSLINKPMELRNPKEKYLFREIQTFTDNPNLFNLDSMNLPSKRPSQTFPNTSSLPLLPISDKRLNTSLLRLPHGTPLMPPPPQQLQTIASKLLSYPEILDTYSLHYLVIRKGTVLGETPEFQSYKRICEEIWPIINEILKKLENIGRNSGIDWMKVDGKKLAKLALKWKREEGIGKKESSIEELLETLAEEGADEVKRRAARKVQSVWRGFLGRRDYRRLKILIGKVVTIQRLWKGWGEGRRGRELRKKRAEKEYDAFLKRMEEFKRDWREIKLKRRVEVHICSFSFEEMKRLTMEKFVQRQNSQICRIFRLKDPNIEIVYVAPFDLSPEIINYFHKVLELSGVPNFKERLHFVWPENHISFPSHFPLSRLLLYSPSCLHRIRLLCSSYPSFILPGPPSNDDIRLSSLLRLPLFSSLPQLHLVLSTASSALSFLSSTLLPLPPSACEIFDEAELLDSLALLITQNPQLDFWFIKIDGESGGRGVAFLDLRRVPGLSRKEREQMRKDERKEIRRFREILARNLEKTVQIACGRLWKNYKEFLKEMERRGGVVQGGIGGGEGVGISFMVEPDGKLELICAYDKIEGKEFMGLGCSFPSKGLEGLNLMAIAESVGVKLFEKGLYGFFTVKLLTFPDPKGEGKKLFWALGLDCYLNQNTCGYFYFDLLMGTRDREKIAENVEDGKYLIRLGERIEERKFVFIPCMYHPGLSNIQYKTFFHMCRIENISFDLERKIGTSFLLVDSLQSAVISLMAVAENDAETYRFMKDAMNFITEHCGTIPKHDEFAELSRSDSISFGDIVGKIRLIYKRIEKNIARKEKKILGKDERFL